MLCGEGEGSVLSCWWRFFPLIEFCPAPGWAAVWPPFLKDRILLGNLFQDKRVRTWELELERRHRRSRRAFSLDRASQEVSAV